MKPFSKNVNDDLLAKFLLQQTDIEENNEITKWVMAKKTHQQYFNYFKLMWEESDTDKGFSFLINNII